MFIVKTDQGDVSESSELNWMGLSDNIQGVYLIHPGLGISIGIHYYDKYVFMGEGAMILQSGQKFNRIAEHLYAAKDDRYVHICLHQTGKVTFNVLDTAPNVADDLWRKKG